MFGIPSLSKLILLAVIIAAVWYGFKMVGRLDSARKNNQGGGRVNRDRADRSTQADVEDTVKCPVCGAYVVASSTSPCERPDCPY